MSTIKVFCDGSCSVHDPELHGAFCSVIDIPGNDLTILKGGQSHTTISKMEIKAVSAALTYLFEYANHRGFPSEIDSVQIYSDSSYVVNCATGENKIKANKCTWSELLTAHSSLLAFIPNIIIIKISRNSEPESEFADKIAGEIREILMNYKTK
jgi:ribonuclease HI